VNIRRALKLWAGVGGEWEHRHSDLYLTHPDLPRPIIQSLCRKTANTHLMSWIKKLTKGSVPQEVRRELRTVDASRFRSFVLRRDHFTCLRCGRDYGPMEAHHVTPRSRGGSHHPGNGATLCTGTSGHQGCHAWVHAYPASAATEGWLATGDDPWRGVDLPWSKDEEPQF